MIMGALILRLWITSKFGCCDEAACACMYEELRSPFSIRWAREAGFGAKSLMRLQKAGLMVESGRKLRLLDASPQQVATTAVGPLVALGQRSAASGTAGRC